MKIRGFERISTLSDETIHVPCRATMASAGYDIESIETVTIAGGETILVQTGLKAYMLNDEVLKIYIRSSVAKKRNLVLANGVGIIDADYYNNPQNEGHILLAIHNHSKVSQIIHKHERVAQGIFVKYLTTDQETFDQVLRTGGFGSSQDQITNLKK